MTVQVCGSGSGWVSDLREVRTLPLPPSLLPTIHLSNSDPIPFPTPVRRWTSVWRAPDSAEMV